MKIGIAPPPLSTGTPLPPTLQHQMETSFGTSFSDVRVHHGHEATMLGANAFTNGNDIHFAPGQYQPHSPTGQELIAHELTHVVQQRQGRVGLAPGLVQF
jgi:predicted SprT family Zn-dependent metalloprotease